jgi:nicotinamidase-related amidase
MNVDLSAGRPAAVVTDVQALFASPDGPFSNDTAGPMIEAINRLLAACRQGGVPVVHSRYVLRGDGRDAGLLGGMPPVQEGLFAAGSEWVRVDDRVRVEQSDLDCVHNRPSAFFGSDLDAVLRSLGADRIVLAGLSLNNAIAATARDAFARDIPVLIARETVAAAPFEPPEDVDAGFRALHQWTAEVAALDDVIDRLPKEA